MKVLLGTKTRTKYDSLTFAIHFKIMKWVRLFNNFSQNEIDFPCAVFTGHFYVSLRRNR